MHAVMLAKKKVVSILKTSDHSLTAERGWQSLGERVH